MALGILLQLKNKPVASNLEWKLSGGFFKDPIAAVQIYKIIITFKKFLEKHCFHKMLL